MKNNITINEKMSDEHMKAVEELRNIKTEDFYKEYINMIVEDRKSDIEKFEEAVSSNGNSDVKDW